MTNKRRRDKESSAGCHRKRTKPLVRKSTPGYGDVSTAPARVAKYEALSQIIVGPWLFFSQDQFTFCRCAGKLDRRLIVPS